MVSMPRAVRWYRMAAPNRRQTPARVPFRSAEGILKVRRAWGHPMRQAHDVLGQDADPVFTGLFPNAMLATDDQPCDCGEEHDQIRPVLRPCRPASDEALAELAAGSELVRQALSLARWVGLNRKLDQNRSLLPDDAAEVARELGLTDPDSTEQGIGSLRALWS